MDDAVDQMNRSSYKTLTRVMEESSHLAPQALNALMISRSLERVADHATNIADSVIFCIRGNAVRHHKSVAAGANAASKDASSGAAPAGAAPADTPPAGT